MKVIVKADVAALRIKRGLSATELAKRTGMTASAICRLEKGVHRNIRPSTAKRLCDALEQPFDKLFTIEY